MSTVREKETRDAVVVIVVVVGANDGERWEGEDEKFEIKR